MHCHPLFVSLAIVLTLIFAIGLVETIPTDWTHSKKLLLALFYLFWAGYITTVYCYWSGFLSWSQSPHPMTYVCILPGQEVLSLRLCFFVLIIPVQAPSGHTLYSVCSHGNQHVCFNSPTALGSNGWRSRYLMVLSGRGGWIRDLINCTQVFNPDKPVSVFFYVCVTISQGRCGGTGCCYEDLAWERVYMLNDKYWTHMAGHAVI
jgi:hypothetical protein